MATLQTVLNYLPRVLSRRYAEPFWVNAANKVLMDIESKQELPRTMEEFGLVLRERMTNYRIPDYVKKLLAVYRVGTPNTNYKLDRVEYVKRGNMMEIPEGFNVSDDILVENEPVLSGDQYVVTAENIPNGVENMLLVVTSGDNATYTSMIQRQDVNQDGSSTLYLKRPLPVDILVGDTINIHEHFLIVEYVKGFERVKDLVCDIVDDERVIRVLEEGLRFYGENQTDEESQFAMRWDYQYKKAVKDYCNYQTRGTFRPPAKMARPGFDKLRGEPSRLYGNTSGVYGDPEQQG